MVDIQKLESLYLRAKIDYYEGNPLISDAEFDSIEKILKESGSKVVEQVGSKRKDFDFTHHTKMLSLGKLQIEATKEGTNYMEDDFMKWYEKNCKLLGIKEASLGASCKFDGNAINITFKGLEFFQTVTRGDGFSGKDITKRFQNHVPKTLIVNDLNIKPEDTIEIRCEVVIPLSIFNEKYKGTKEEGKFANARNYVAGVIGKDDFDEEKVSELVLLPVHYLVNGVQVSQSIFNQNDFCKESYEISFAAKNYVSTIKYFEDLREKYQYLLDGVVITFPVQYREKLGVNDHDPNWAIAIKFVPEESITGYDGIEWNVSKRGELTPVILLKPVQLAGTTVKRASGYNAGYIVNNKIGPGALLIISKAGDIIPEVQKVTIPSNLDIVLPTHCPNCQTKLEFDSIHLTCQNELCGGRISKKLSSAAGTLDLKGVGGKTLEPFASDFPNMFELMRWVLLKGESKEIEKYGIEYKSRSHEIFVNAFKNIQSLTYEKVIIILGYDNVGKKLSIQLAKEHAGLEPNYFGLEKALVDKLHEKETEEYIKFAVKTLEDLGVIIDKPSKEAKKSESAFGICMTGSPKVFGYKTKAEFLAKFPGLWEADLKEAKYLITDDYNSTSSKMKDANKRGVEIKTYGDFKL